MDFEAVFREGKLSDKDWKAFNSLSRDESYILSVYPNSGKSFRSGSPLSRASLEVTMRGRIAECGTGQVSVIVSKYNAPSGAWG